MLLATLRRHSAAVFSSRRPLLLAAPHVAARSSLALRSLSTPASSSSSPLVAPVAFILHAGDKHTVDAVVEERAEPGKSKYTQQAVIRGTHPLLLDELGVYGGLDLGPSPYDLLLAALGGCTSMTIRMYCERKSLALPPIRLSLLHSKKNAAEIAECPPEVRGLCDLFEVSLASAPPTGDQQAPTAEQKAHLIEIAAKCPVHKTLAGNPRTFVRTRWE